MTAPSTSYSTSCPPRYATRRRPERETFGAELAAIARKLGQPLMPWQRLVADVGCEIDPATGLPAYREVRVTVPRQSGKALDVSTPILTYNRGWVTMGELRRGDAVFHPDGAPVAVSFVSEIMNDHECFRVTTVDGRSVVADADHLWTVTDKRSAKSRGPRGGSRRRSFEQRTLTTRELLDGGLSRYASGGRTSTTGGKKYATNEYRYVLPTQEPLKTSDADLPIDPYLFGAWLGDGNSAGGRLTCHASEAHHWAAAIEAAGFIPTVVVGGGTPDTRHVGITTSAGVGRHQRSFDGKLRRLGVLGDKHVPDLYLTAGTSQREALLQGLCDTDGTIEAARSQVEFCSTNRRLADAVLYLARSLGWRATLKTGRATLNGKGCGEKYRVCWTPKRSDPFVPFRLDRKVARIHEHDGGKGRASLSVATIEPVESRPVRCIKVDSPDGLFLAGRDLIPTHNTTLFLSWQINRCVSKRWKHPQRSVFTAQTGKDARDKWLDELFPLIRNSAIRTLVSSKGKRLEINEGMGNESIKFKTGSLIRLLSTSTTSGHSKTLHQAVMDEVWHDTDDRREQGLRPAMITMPDAQLLVCSTAGTDASVILNRKVETGRAAVLADVGTGVAYFEWSAPDDDEWDPFDDDSFFDFHPALCPDPPCRCAPPSEGWRHTMTIQALRTERDAMELPEFCRAYGNRKPSTASTSWKVITEGQWKSRRRPDSQLDGRPAYAVAVPPDRSFTAIGVAGASTLGGKHIEITGDGKILDYRPGTAWAVPRLVEMEKHNPSILIIDDKALADEAEQAGLTVHRATAADVVTGCQLLYDGVADPDEDARDVWHIGQEDLTVGVAGAIRRNVGTSWAWARRDVSVDTTQVAAVSLALRGHCAPQLQRPELVPLVAWR